MDLEFFKHAKDGLPTAQQLQQSQQILARSSLPDASKEFIHELFERLEDMRDLPERFNPDEPISNVNLLREKAGPVISEFMNSLFEPMGGLSNMAAHMEDGGDIEDLFSNLSEEQLHGHIMNSIMTKLMPPVPE